MLEASRLLRSAVQALAAGDLDGAAAGLLACLEQAATAPPGRARDLILGHAFLQRAQVSARRGELKAAQSALRNGWSYARTTRDHALSKVARDANSAVRQLEAARGERQAGGPRPSPA